MFVNQSIRMLTIVWNEKRFVESKSARQAARRCVHRAANIQLSAELKNLDNRNNDIRHEMNRCDQDLRKYDEKLQILDNMTQLATESLESYFRTRMENLRAFVGEQCRIISDGIQEEADHWREIHAMLQQKLVVPGDLRSYGGGNGLPRGVKQSPNFSQIAEEEEEEEEDDEEDEKRADVSILLQSRTLTPLLTQTLKKARLRASKRSQDTSLLVPVQLNMSTSMHDETMIEEPEYSAKPTSNHMTLRDVSAIAKETEMDADMTNADLSVSLLPFIPTVNYEESKQHNKSIASNISDKTFVKLSLKPIISEDETGNDSTLVDDSFLAERKENTRPLLLTADQSIRLDERSARAEKSSVSNKSIEERPKVKREKISFQEPTKPDKSLQRNRLGKTFLLNNNTFDAEKSDYVRPTIIITNEAGKLSPIVSDESENDDDHGPSNKFRRVEKKSSNDSLSTSTSANRSRTFKSPLVTQLPPPVPTGALESSSSSKRRTTRRTTIRLLQDSQNTQSIEMPTKTRYPTRYSTRLATSTSTEELTVSTTSHRRTTRLTSE